MAKNKKKGKSNNNNNSNNSSNSAEAADPVTSGGDTASVGQGDNNAPETPQQAEEALAPETPQQSDQNPVEQSEAPIDNGSQATKDESVDQMSLDDLKAEVLGLRQQLKVKDKEIAELKAQVSKPFKSVASGVSPVTDMAQLQERLAKLRREQAEADAARDAAWGQLKSVVAEISKLANPDYVASLVKQQTATAAPSDNGSATA